MEKLAAQGYTRKMTSSVFPHSPPASCPYSRPRSEEHTANGGTPSLARTEQDIKWLEWDLTMEKGLYNIVDLLKYFFHPDSIQIKPLHSYIARFKYVELNYDFHALQSNLLIEC